MLTLSYLTCWEIFDQSFWKLVTLYSSNSLEFDRKLEITFADIVITGFPARPLQKFPGSWVFHHVFISAQWHNMTHQHRLRCAELQVSGQSMLAPDSGRDLCLTSTSVSRIITAVSFHLKETGLLLCRPVRIFFPKLIKSRHSQLRKQKSWWMSGFFQWPLLLHLCMVCWSIMESSDRRRLAWSSKLACHRCHSGVGAGENQLFILILDE